MLLRQVYSQYSDTMETVLALRGWSGTSIETAATAFAANHPRKVAALLLDQKQEDSGQPCLRLARKACSPLTAKSLLGTIEKGQAFPSDHAIYRCSRGSTIESGEITIGNKGPDAISLLNTSYRVIALLVDKS